jgi:predicted GNAT family acetyltransferase
VQLWVAQPDATRAGPAAFAHHAELPSVRLAGGTATVLVGELDGHTSPARADTPLIGADLALDGRADLSLRPDFEHGIAVLAGGITVDGTAVGADAFALLGSGRNGIVVEAAPGTRALLLGGRPIDEELFMWWNFVARDAEEVEFEVRVDGVLAGVAEYERRPDRIVFTHTEVDPAYTGHGIATRLIRDALDTARAEGVPVVARCPFVAAFIRDHPDYRDLVRRAGP